MAGNGITTKKGTFLPFMSLKGKDYLQVMHRLVWFREEHPAGRIESTLVALTENYAVFKAHISVLGSDGQYTRISEGTKREDTKHFADFMEKAETGAIGRALAAAGYGTQFSPELDEGERIVDSPVPPKTQAPATTTTASAPAAEAPQAAPAGKRPSSFKLAKPPAAAPAKSESDGF